VLWRVAVRSLVLVGLCCSCGWLQVELLLQSVRYSRLGNRPLYVQWSRGDKKSVSSRAVSGEEGGLYDFTGGLGEGVLGRAAAGVAGATSPLSAAALNVNPPLRLECTMYEKKGKFLPKKSKLFLYEKRRGVSGDELKLGQIEIDIAAYLDASKPSAVVSTGPLTLTW